MNKFTHPNKRSKVPKKNKLTGLSIQEFRVVHNILSGQKKGFKLQNPKNSWGRGGENFTSYRRRGISES